MANLAVAPPVSDHREVRARRLVVIDDHETFADLLSVGLRGEPDLDCVGVAYDIDAGLALVDEVQPDGSKGRIADNEIWNIVNYVRSLGPKKK